MIGKKKLEEEKNYITIKLENILLFPNKTNYKNNFELDKIYKIGDFG